jgi:sigma-B regulation protein RsbU (phosphoserine phosphatase)
MKIRAKYSVILASLLLLSSGTLAGLALRHHQRALTREALLRAESIAVNLALVSAEAILTKNMLQLVPLSMDATTRHENVAYAAVTDVKGRVLAHPDRAAIDKPFVFESSGEESSFGLQAKVLSGKSMGHRLWDVSVPVKAKGSLLELGRVHVGLDKATVERSVARSLMSLILASVGCLALGLVVAFPAVAYLTQPLKQLSQASGRVGEGDFGVQVPVQSKDEIGELASNFNSMVEKLKLAEARRKEAQRLESELELAHGIQKGLFPQKNPELSGLELAFYCEPAKELGGDYYDWYQVAGGAKLGFLVADVSGKGVPAALHMANLRNLFRFSTETLESPLEVLRQVNRLAFPDLRAEAFVTLIYAVLDPATGLLRYVNAGHDPAFLSRSDGGMESFEATAFPVGVVDAGEFEAQASEKSAQMRAGDLLFLYTDGVTEAADASQRQYGLPRIRKFLNGKAPASVLESIRLDLQEYRAGRAPHDDVTMMALKWGGPSQG